MDRLTGSCKVLQIVVRSLDFTQNTMQGFPAGEVDTSTPAGSGAWVPSLVSEGQHVKLFATTAKSVP